MVGSEFKGRPGDRVLQLLVQSGLMISTFVRSAPLIIACILTPGRLHRSGNSLTNLKITSEGFQFLLEEVNTQLWDLLLEYLRNSNVSGDCSGVGIILTEVVAM